ncbi:MAG: TonB-dependent receptor [Bacteroidales bacterium]
MRRLINVYLFVMIAASLGAQVPTMETLDSVVVYSPRILQHIRETGRDITVLSRRELQAIPASSLDELLRFIPGVETQQRGIYGVQGDLSLRGSTFAQVLVLLDGMRVNDPLTGHFSNNFPVTISDIERIEIIRGPSSAAYGPDAVGGIINIITKAFSANTSEHGIHSSGSLIYGENKLLATEGGLHGRIGKLFLGAGGAINKSDGYPNENGQAGRFDIRTGTVSARLPLGDHLLVSYRLSADHRDFSAWHFYTTSKADTATETTRSVWNQLRVISRQQKSTSILELGYKTMYDDYLFNSVSLPNSHQTRMLNVQLSHQFELSHKLSLQGGIQALQSGIESSDRGNHELSTGGTYLLGFWKPSRRLTINFGGRLEYNEVYGSGLLPQAALSWKVNQFTFRAATGKSFRAPDFTERFVGTALPYLAPNRSLGNPDLLPEKSWTHELGADWQAGTPFKASITFFSRNGTDLIDYIRTYSADIRYNSQLEPDTTYFQARNFSKLTTSGMELRIGSSLGTGNWQFGMNLGYTYLITQSEEEVVSRYLSNHSRHLLTGNVEATGKQIHAGIAFIWKQRNMNPSMTALGMSQEFFSLNGQLSWHLMKSRLSLELKINNLTDKRNMDIPGLTLPGRWISGGLGWRV